MGLVLAEFLPQKEVSATRSFITTEHLPNGSVLYVEGIDRPDLGMASVIGNFGHMYTRADFENAGLKMDRGFDRVYRPPEGMPEEAALVDEYAAIRATVAHALDAAHWKPEDVEAAFIGSGTPPKDRDFSRDVLDMCGLTNARITHRAHLACNTGGDLLLRSFSYTGKRVLVVADEGMLRLSSSLGAENADPLSKSVFSDAVVAVAFTPGKSLSLVPQMVERGALQDPGALAAIETYDLPTEDFWYENDTEGVSMIRFPKPPSGKAINMNGFETAKLFLGAIPPRILDVVGKYIARYGSVANIQFAVPHPASMHMVEGLSRKMDHAGIPIDFPWVVRDGNSSASATLKAFTRLLSRMQEGKDILVVSFGAGISWSIYVARVGMLKEARPA